VCGVGGIVFVVGSNISIHHRFDGFLLGFAILVEVIAMEFGYDAEWILRGKQTDK